MAILLYANGLTEEPKPIKYTFTDKELLDLYQDFDGIRSFRLYEVPNTWCIWGENIPREKRADEFHNVGTLMVDIPIFSPILFIHDTEINPAWRLTDEMIVMGYNDFKFELGKYFEDVAAGIQKQQEKIKEQEGSGIRHMELVQVSVSDDKRIIYKFNPNRQPEQFYLASNLMEFANKIHKFLKFNYKDGQTFVLYADKNMIVIMEDHQVKEVLEKIIALFESRENYEACSILRNTFAKWEKFKVENPRPAPKPDDEGKDKKK